MNIDPRKIQLAEKDIEDWLFETPTAVYGVVKWVGRQVQIPSGRIDLLGFNEHGNYVVVEIKNSQPSPAALTQVCRYASDIEWAISKANPTFTFSPWKILVCKEPIDNQILFEANALQVLLQTFDVSFKLKMSGRWDFTKEFTDEMREQIGELAESGIFADIAMPKEQQEELRQQRRQRIAEMILKEGIDTSGDD